MRGDGWESKGGVQEHWRKAFLRYVSRLHEISRDFFVLFYFRFF